MIKPEFLPFDSTDFTQNQALLAGAYLLDLDNRTGFGDDPNCRERIKQELTGFTRGVGIETKSQHAIIKKVADTLVPFVVGRRRIDPHKTVEKIHKTIGL